MSTPHSRLTRIALVALLAALGCSPEEDDPVKELFQTKQPLFLNGGFESGGGSLTNWTVSTYLNNTGIAAVPPTSIAQLNLAAGGNNYTFARTNAVPESQLFAGMSAAAGVPRWPKFGTTSAVINETAGVDSTNVNSLRQAYVVTNADVSPVDNLIHVRWVLAPALQAAGHAPAQQPYFFVVLTNVTTGATLYTNYNYANNPGVPWKAQGTGATAVLYTDWVIFDIAPGNALLKVGDNLQVEIFASRCQPSGHFGEVYVDGFGSNFPGLSIYKTAPQSANIDSDITYDFVIENNTSGIAPNVVATETIPFGTTFQSVTTSYPGASCTAPMVGQTGTITCNFGYLNPSATATFSVTVRAFAPAALGSGTASAGAAGTMTDASKTWTVDAFAGYSVYITGGQGVGQYRTILSNTATVLTIAPNWTTNPNATSTYKIVDPPIDTGTVTNQGGSTLTDSSKAWAANGYVAYTVTVLTGTGAGQQRTIVTNTGTQLTVSPAWTTQPPNGSRYAIGLPPTKVTNGNYTVAASTIASLLGPRVETNITAGVTYTDLGITVSNGQAGLNWGQTPVTYTLTVTNYGPSAVTGATVTDTFPAQLTGITWTCSATAGSTCAASGMGNINQLVNLAVGGTATFTVTASVIAGMGNSSTTNTASVAAPAGVTDSDSTNNADADTDGIGPLFLLTLDKPVSDTGRGTVTSAPVVINCGIGCSSDSASFSSGTSVTLTAVARPNDVFLGWEGDCSSAGTSPTCTLTMSAARNVTARFRGPAITGSAGTGGTVVCSPATVLQGASSVCTITPGADYVLLTLTDNTVNVLASVVGNTYTLTNVTVDHAVAATFNARPNITSTAPSVAAAGTAYNHTPAATDPDGNVPLTWSADPGDTCGGTVNSGTGAYSFTPGVAASCTVGLRVCDAAAVSACRTQLTVVTINHAPVPTNDTLTTSPNTAATVSATTLASNDSAGGPVSESGTQTLTVTGVSATSAQGGTVTLLSGTVTYTPPNGFAGTDTFTYTVADNGSPVLSATGTVTVTVVNAAPVITSTAGTTATEDTVYTYNATRTDADGPSTTWSLLGTHTCGGSIVAGTGVFTFTPAGPVPAASCVVAIQICDGGIPNRCATQTTTVNITAVNDAPVISSTAATTATEDTVYTYNATRTDPDGPGQTWTTTAAHTCGGSIVAGTGVFTFTPTGPVPIASCVVAIQICDGGTPNLCATQSTTVNVTAVNDAPVISSTAGTTATEDTVYTYNATRTDADGPGQTWTTTAAHTCGGSIVAGTGVFTFTPVGPTPAASCVVAIQVCDGGTPNLCATQSTTVNITAVNDAPVISSTAATTATEDTVYTYNATRTDPDGPGQTWTTTAAHTCGGSIVAGTGVFTFTPTGPVPVASCVVAIQICDGGTPNLCATQSTTVNVTAVNDAPVISSTAGTTATEDTVYTYNATRTDADGPGQTWTTTAAHTCGGSIVAGTGVFTFTPVGPTPAASCVVAIQVCDGGTPNLCATQSTTVNITAVNDAPVITSTAATTATEDTVYTYNATRSDADGPGQTWTTTAAHTCGGSIVAGTGVFTFTPVGPTPAASCVVAIQVCDGGTPNLCATQSTTVNITATNDAPVITSTAPTTATEDTVYTYNATRSDADGPGQTWTVPAADTCGGSIVAGTGVYTFTPAGPTPPASCVVAVQVCDGGTPNLCATQTTTVNVTAENDAPVITSTAPTTATEDTVYTYNGTRSDADGPGTTWSVPAADTCGGSINASTGVYTFTPAGPTPPATCVVAIQVCDGATPDLCATQTTTVNIAAVNDAPVITSTAPTGASEGNPYTYNATRFDPDGPGTTWSVPAADTCGGSINASTGVYTFTPVGPTPPPTCVAAVQVCDGAMPDLCAIQTSTITISSSNNPPTITSTPPTTATEDVPLTYTVTSSDGDGPGATYTLDPANTCGGSIDSSTGVYTMTPAGPTPPATCVLVVRVCDGGTPNECATQTTTITITPVNDAPTITSTAPVTATEGQPLTYTPAVTDPDGPSATWSVGAGDTCGGMVAATTGTYTFTPPGPTPPATCVMSVRVCDGATPDECATQTTTVTITPVNNPPTITSTPATTTVTAGQPLSYPATATDPDSTTLTWTVGTTDTCGGSINASGVYTFTPPSTAPAGTCIASVRVCDGGTPEQCATQDTTITVTAANAPPDITTTPPPGGTPGQPFTYPAAAVDPEGKPLTWSVTGADTCGGTVDPATGEYTFTPPNPSPPDCVISVKACDDGQPAQCTTQTTTITLSGRADGFAEDVGVSGGGCRCSGASALPSAFWGGALLLFLRRRRRA